MARIAVAGFRHETNTFAPARATLQDFEQGYSWPPLTRGAGLFEAMAGFNLALSGFIEAAGEEGHELVPLVWASASPSAHVTEDAYETIATMLMEELEGAGAIDALYLSLHGAMVTEHLDDGEGELLERLRARLGADLPVAVTLDYHANVSRRMVEHATWMLGYREYPHSDMAATGRRMAGWLSAHLSDPEPPARAFRQIPFLIPLPWGCTMMEPARTIARSLPDLEREHGVLLTFAAGFPAADVPDCGPSVFAYGSDAATVERAVDTLAGTVEARESHWAGEMHTPEAAVARAVRLANQGGPPVVLADVQDNPGAGGTSDTTRLLRTLVEADARDAVLGLMFDPHVATIAHRAGEGAEIHVALGGKHMDGDAPFDATFVVERLADGHVTGSGPLYGGARMDLAPMCCLRLGGVRVVVVGKRVQAADLEFFRHVGIEPTETAILAIKSSAHFRGAFEPIAREILNVEAPGPVVVDPAHLDFRHIRPGIRLRPGGPTRGE